MEGELGAPTVGSAPGSPVLRFPPSVFSDSALGGGPKGGMPCIPGHCGIATYELALGMVQARSPVCKN